MLYKFFTYIYMHMNHIKLYSFNTLIVKIYIISIYLVKYAYFQCITKALKE